MNKVELVGRLTRDPELRTTASGSNVASFTVAVNRPVSSQNGERQADFISCSVWNKQAENLAKYCHKGDLIGVEGSIRTRSYDAQDGTKRYTTEVLADRIEFLTPKGGNAGFNNAPASDFAPESNNTGNPSSDIATTDITEDPFKDFGDEVALSDDDLPF